MLEAREGDFVENVKGVVFDVKGLIQPPDRIVAYPRFIPDSAGERVCGATSYGKMYSFSDRLNFIKHNYPHYLVRDGVFDETICEVPVDEVKKHYEPTDRLQELCNSHTLDPLEGLALQLAQLVKETANISWKVIGVSGSILVGLHTANSDIDPIVYGSQDCRKAHDALKNLLRDEKSPFKSYNRGDLKTLFDFRSKDTATSFEDFVRTESRKVIQGRFMNTDYFMRFVKNRNEVDEKYGDVRFTNVGHARIRATVSNASESIFTPCSYGVENAVVVEGSRMQPISEIVSYRGRFCEQARVGESVMAQGKIERVADDRHEHYCLRLLIGNAPSDFMVLA